jgi:hypothetical protein
MPSRSARADGNFSLLGSLPDDALETISSYVLETSSTEVCLVGGKIPEFDRRTIGCWGSERLCGFYYGGVFNVTTPLECQLLRLNANNTDFADGDAAALPLPAVPEFENGLPIPMDTIRGTQIHAINETGNRIVVDGSGKLRLNMSAEMLSEINETGELTNVSFGHVSAELRTSAWISDLIVLPDAQLLPFAAAELRAKAPLLSLSKTVKLVGRPRVYATIPVAARVPFERAPVWYSVMPASFQEAAKAVLKKNKKVDYPSLVAATIWMAGEGSGAGVSAQQALETFYALPEATRKGYGVEAACFQPTRAGERLRRASAESGEEAARAAAARAELDALFEF